MVAQSVVGALPSFQVDLRPVRELSFGEFLQVTNS